tara:strand:+ start:2169 stop:3077 length:909 start_codon:yes stop_codon:yes gene_type:complete
VVLFLYNKPDTTQKVLRQIKKVQPSKLYLIADGPKNEIDRLICQQTRNTVEIIDWECEVERVYQNENIGLIKTFNQGLGYVFEKEKRAIILEDDTLPSKSFFRYCDDLLDKYESNKKIGQINGYNYLSKVKVNESYYYSNYPELWGWATWSDRWTKYNNHEFDDWDKIKNSDSFKNKFFSNNEYEYYYTIFDNASQGKIVSWEFPWSFAFRTNQLLAISPKFNLVKNLGFGHIGATHTHQRHKYLSVTRNKKFNMKFPMIPPSEVFLNDDLTIKEFNKRLLKNSNLSKLIYNFNKLKKLIKN